MLLHKKTPNLRLRDERQNRHWSQQELADQVGTTLNTVSRWERGITECSPYYRSRLCEIFNKDAIELGLTATGSEQVTSPLYDPALPAANPLIGQEALLHQLKLRLCENQNGTITALVGLPGIGKSALTIVLAHDPTIQEHFHEGILWVDLGPEPNIFAILDRWKVLLGLPPSDGNDGSSKDRSEELLNLRITIGKRRLLIIIDDAWRLEDILDFIQVGGPNCTYLITTRFVNIALHVAGEAMITIPELSENESLLLLSQLAPSAVKAEPKCARVLAQTVGGLPLAITLMGKYLRLQAHHRQPRRLRFALEWLLNAEKRLQLEQPLISPTCITTDALCSLQATIAVSDRYLNKFAQNALRTLSVFPAKPNTFSEDAALAVTDVSVEILDNLSDAGLLESNGPGRYCLHQCIADYAAFHNTSAFSEHRLVNYMTKFVEVHKGNYEILKLEMINILAALNIAHKLNLVVAQVRMIVALFGFLNSSGFCELAEYSINRMLQSTHKMNEMSTLVSVLLHVGKIGSRQEQDSYPHSDHHPPSFKANLQHCSVIPNQDGHREQQCLIFSTWNKLNEDNKVSYSSFLQQEEYSISQPFSESPMKRPIALKDTKNSFLYGLQEAKEHNNYEHVCVFTVNLVALACEQNDYEEAEAFLQECLQLPPYLLSKRSWLLLLFAEIHLAFEQRKMEGVQKTINILLETTSEEQLVEAIRYYCLIRISHFLKHKKNTPSCTLHQ